MNLAGTTIVPHIPELWCAKKPLVKTVLYRNVYCGLINACAVIFVHKYNTVIIIQIRYVPAFAQSCLLALQEPRPETLLTSLTPFNTVSVSQYNALFTSHAAIMVMQLS